MGEITYDSREYIICFVFLIANSNSVPTVERSIQVNKQGQMSYAVNGKLIDITEQGIEVAKNIDDFSNNVKKFESKKLCYGSSLANISNFPKDFCTKSNKGFLHHNVFSPFKMVQKTLIVANVNY